MKKVLLISTDNDVLNFFKANSSVLDMDVQVAQSPEGLLSNLRYTTPDLLIIDFILNEGNGAGLCHQVKCDDQLHNMPVVLLSEYPSMDRIYSKFGCNTIVNKPLNLKNLSLTLSDMPQSAQMVH